MRSLAKLNNVYRKFCSSNKKGILELEVDNETFYIAEQSLKEKTKIYIDFEENDNSKIPLYKEIMNILSIISEKENTEKSKLYINLLKNNGKFQTFTVSSECSKDLIELWCKNKPLCYAEKEKSNLTRLEKVKLYQGIDTYSFEEICNIMKLLKNKCEKYNIEMSEKLRLCVELNS